MIIDAAVHPVLGDTELRTLLAPPWNKARIPNLLGTRYQPPFDELVVPVDRAGDPAVVAEAILGDGAVDAAIITPLTRGLMPNPQHAAALARAANEWVAARWLTFEGAHDRFYGSIRVAVNAPQAAVAEIEKWADDPRFVQVAVALRAFAPFGDESFFPIWRAAAEHGLPVSIYDDASTVTEPYDTPVGALRFFTEKHGVRPFAGIVHLASLVTSGTFDRLPDLRVVVGDVSADLARPMFWRIDKDWRQGRNEIPWVERPPSEYLIDHVRFISQPEDGRPDGVQVEDDVIRISDSEHLVVFGSRYPYWDGLSAQTALDGWPDAARERVLATNALEFYPRLASAVAAPSSAPTAH